MQIECHHQEGGLWTNTKNNQKLKTRQTYLLFIAYLSSKCISTNQVVAELAHTYKKQIKLIQMKKQTDLRKMAYLSN